MFGRFTPREHEGASGLWGVWDSGVVGWREKDLPSRLEAERAATELDLRYDALGVRDPATIRRLEIPQPVLWVDQWRTGVIDVWVRDNRLWYGRVTAPDGRIRWVDGHDLRRAGDTR